MATNRVQVKWRVSGFRDLRRDPAVIRELERRGRQIASAANKTLDENKLRNKVAAGRARSVGYKVSSFQGRRKPQGRWFVQVYTSSRHAKYSNARHNTLIRVLNETQHPTPEATSLQPEYGN